jgi:hypothetical protein
MTRADPSAGGMLQDWISLGTYWWLVLACIAVAVLVILTINFVQVMREQDEPAPAPHVVNWCDRNGHTYRTTSAGGWHCISCGHTTRQPLTCRPGSHRYATRGQSLTCTVCGHRTALPYDQENGVA